MAARTAAPAPVPRLLRHTDVLPEQAATPMLGLDSKASADPILSTPVRLEPLQDPFGGLSRRRHHRYCPCMDVAGRHNLVVRGRQDGPPMLFSHGYGCDQNMWRYVAPAFEDRFRVILFDHVGAGGSDLASYDPVRHGSLHGYALDVLEICRELDLRDVVFVGHSVSAMVGVLAAVEEPDRFSKLVLVAPSPRYTDDGGYRGGFTETDIEEMLESLDSNYLGWSSAMAPVIMGNPDRPELGQELVESFCRTDPSIARRFATVTFRSDNRADLSQVTTPTLVLQCTNDVIAPVSVGEYVRDTIPGAQMVLLDATGHCPNLSAPAATVAAIADFVRS